MSSPDMIFVGMIAVNNMARHKLVKQPGYDLNAKKATHEACHHDETRTLLVPVVLDEIPHRRRKHTIQSREQLMIRKYMYNT